MIEHPMKGERISAAWAAAVTSGLNDLAPMGGGGLLARQGLGGAGFARLPENKRGWTGSGVYPFAVRKVTESDDDETIPYTGWEIYLPDGCVTCGESCKSLNPAAYRTVDGATVCQTGWYRLAAPASEPTAAENWAVKVHAKACAALQGADTFAEWPRHYLWAQAWDPDDETDQTAREEAVADLGDCLAVQVGSIRWTLDATTGDAKWSYSHAVKTPIATRETAQQETFALYHCFSVDDDDVTLELEKLYLRNLVFNAAGVSYVGPDIYELDAAHESVWLVIDTTTTPYTARVATFAAITAGQTTLTVPQQVTAARQDGEIWCEVYQLKNGHVVYDNRKALANIQVYQ